MSRTAKLALADQVIAITSGGIDQMVESARGLMARGLDRSVAIAALMQSIVLFPMGGRENERALAIAIMRLTEAQDEIARLRAEAGEPR